jgi:hypothetical protein
MSAWRGRDTTTDGTVTCSSGYFGAASRFPNASLTTEHKAGLDVPSSRCDTTTSQARISDRFINTSNRKSSRAFCLPSPATSAFASSLYPTPSLPTEKKDTLNTLHATLGACK